MKCCFYLPVFFIFIYLFSACGNNEKKQTDKFDIDSLKKPLEKVNKKLIKTEDEQIQDLIARYGWNMQKTGTGLRYLIYNKGKGIKASLGKIAKINFEVRLITGDICYSSKNEGTKELLIGKSGEVSGLEEGILLLSVGDKAKFIIPSHLAFGLLGDEKKIPTRATLVYDVELLQIN